MGKRLCWVSKMFPKPITSRDVDHRIQEMGIRLEDGQERLRERVLRELQLERRRQLDRLNYNNVPSLPMHLLDQK